VTVDVAIVGGGVAGLAAAFELKKIGASFVVVEASPRAGGVIVSETVDGFTVDGGPDALLTQKREGIRLCEELGIGNRLVATKPPRIAYVQRGGRLVPLPAASVFGIPTQLRSFVGTRLFSWPGKMRMAAEVFVPPRKDEEDESIASFIGRRFGAEAVTYLAEPLLAGIHAGDVNRLSMRALFPHLVDAERRHGSVLRAFRRRPRSQSTGDAAQRQAEGAFKSLPGGLSELVQALVAALPTGSIRLNEPVARVDAVDQGMAYAAVTAAGRIDARAAILAVPAFATAALVRELDPVLARLCAEIPYASAATVALGFEGSAVGQPLIGSGFVVPRVEKSGILAASFLSSKWPHRAEGDRILVRTFIGGTRDPEAVGAPDVDLVARSLDALRPLIGIRGTPIFSRVYRFPRANAQHEVGHLARVTAIERALAGRPGLFVTGSGFRATGIPDCVADARATARTAVEFLRARATPVAANRQS